MSPLLDSPLSGECGVLKEVSMADVAGFISAQAARVEDHLRRYLADGEDGHVLYPGEGGSPDIVTLILKTIGRRSGRPFLNPLIYKKVGEEFVVIGSKGGADDHPDWFLNLVSRPDVSFQVVNDRYLGTWRIAEEEEERKVVWDIITEYYPRYRQYQLLTERQIPLIMLTAVKAITSL
jgi:deazaflavin-dependent oxidoreductase (nitroreductase family)